MSVEITWWGHATATVRDSGTTLLTDPLLTRGCAHLRRRRGPLPPPAASGADAVLVSHLHCDHLHLPSLARLPAGTPVLLPRGAPRAVPLLRRLARRLEVCELAAGDRVPVGGVVVRAVPAEHDGRWLPFARRRVTPLGFVVEGAGRTYFAGDTDLFPGMADAVGPVDAALLPVGGWGPGLGHGHLDAGRAAEALTRLRPRCAVPVHYGTFWPWGLSAVRPHEFHAPGDEFVRHAARLAPEVAVHRLRHGESLRLAVRG
ncbi:MBL fold metallo-hydrolase [Streptomyces sp. DSM 44915]|uniref:MBL fold metallo-hydrolase n=1 Tax=Streptomyces chisholmiae TaxID=3075540 RepID=A0ABU2JN49_9ACTN|nr:MBL fold metallo-hydrolase [Streptomyces sp. DSM 44915]MDT0266417.1 MBL fold metallo-hydrolase [Streptomyces sp. DSM 44915]